MLELETHRFEGTEPNFVVIIAGLHASEQAGIEIARWITVKLAARDKPTRLSAVVIPEIFPERARAARTEEFPKNDIGNWREDDPSTRKKYAARTKTTAKDQKIFPARQFPPPGKPLGFLSKGLLRNNARTDIVDDNGKKVPLQPEIKYLLGIIEALKPVRIVTIHGKRRRKDGDLEKAVVRKVIAMTKDQIEKWTGQPIKGVNFAGIFVDPRYTVSSTCMVKGSLEPCKFDPDIDPAFPRQGDKDKKRFDSARTSDGRADDALCLAIAKAVGDNTLVPGNHLDDPIPVVHYAEEDTPNGYSLGDWGPVDVMPGKSTPDSRTGAPVFTIEVDQNYESWAFFDGIQMVTEDGKPLLPSPTPPDRANKTRLKVVSNPSFDRGRSKDLQAYARAIIDTVLEK